MGNTQSTIKFNLLVTKVSNIDMPLVPFIHTIVSISSFDSLGDVEPTIFRKLMSERDLILGIKDIRSDSNEIKYIPIPKNDGKLGINVVKLSTAPMLLNIKVLSTTEESLLRLNENILGIEGIYCESEDELVYKVKCNTGLLNLVVLRDGQIETVAINRNTLGCELGVGILYKIDNNDYFIKNYNSHIKFEIQSINKTTNISDTKMSIQDNDIKSNENNGRNVSSMINTNQTVNATNDQINISNGNVINTDKTMNTNDYQSNNNIHDNVINTNQTMNINDDRTNISNDNDNMINTYQGMNTNDDQTNNNHVNLNKNMININQTIDTNEIINTNDDRINNNVINDNTINTNDNQITDKNLNNRCEDEKICNSKEAENLYEETNQSNTQNIVEAERCFNKQGKKPEQKRTSSYTYTPVRTNESQKESSTKKSVDLAKEFNESVSLNNENQTIKHNHDDKLFKSPANVEKDSKAIVEKTLSQINIDQIFQEADVPKENNLLKGCITGEKECSEILGSSFISKEDFIDEKKKILKESVFEERKGNGINEIFDNDSDESNESFKL